MADTIDVSALLVQNADNIDEEEELAMGFEVRSIPFVVKIKNGKIVDSFVGLHPESFVEEFFAK